VRTPFCDFSKIDLQQQKVVIQGGATAFQRSRTASPSPLRVRGEKSPAVLAAEQLERSAREQVVQMENELAALERKLRQQTEVGQTARTQWTEELAELRRRSMEVKARLFLANNAADRETFFAVLLNDPATLNELTRRPLTFDQVAFCIESALERSSGHILYKKAGTRWAILAECSEALAFCEERDRKGEGSAPGKAQKSHAWLETEHFWALCTVRFGHHA